MEIEQAVHKILKVSPSVRVVTVCDLKGKVVFSETKDHFPSLFLSGSSTVAGSYLPTSHCPQEILWG